MIKHLYKLMLLLAFMPAAALAQTYSAKSTAYEIPDSVISRAVRIGVQQALAAHDQMGLHQVPVVNHSRKKSPSDKFRDKYGLNVINPQTGQVDSTLFIRSQHKRHIERVNRDDLKATFIPKGTWMFGGTINYQEWDTDNMNLLVLKNMEHEGHVMSGSPYFGYFVARNVAIGGRYSYTRNYFYLGQFDLNLGEDFNISLADLYYLGHRHTGSMFVRTYMPIGKSKIFGFFSEFDGQYSYENSKNSTGRGEEFDGSYETSHTVSLGFMPGLSAFVTDFAAVEASIGIMGLNYRWSDSKTNQIEVGKTQSGGANFKFNLFSVNIGMSFYF